MGISRRRLLAATGAGVMAVAINSRGQRALAAPGSPSAVAPLASPGAAPGLTTMGQTVQLGNDLGKGYRKLIAGLGEGHVVRTDITATRTNVTYALTAFAHLSDLHIVDDQSPLRVEWLDRLANDDAPGYGDVASAYRPNEFLSTHMVDAMCRAIRKVGRGPRTSLPLSMAMVTGDVVDNCQHNETRWYIGILDGQPIRADSGEIGKDESVSGKFGLGGFGNALPHDTNYWSPAPPGILEPSDHYVTAYGFPHFEGLLEAARAGYSTTGLGIPWYSAFGNHDRALQGNLPIDFTFLEGVVIDADPRAISVGSSKPTGSVPLPPNPGDDAWIDLLNHLKMQPITADPQRWLLNQHDFMLEHLSTTGLPRGHGFGTTAETLSRYYTIPSGPEDLIQHIVVDSTVRIHAQGGIDAGQFDWLHETLRANSSRYFDLNNPGRLITQPGVQDKLFVISCHHNIASMTSSYVGYPADVMFERLLLSFPNVILLVDGHTHANTITPYVRPSNFSIPGGFWEVNSASHVDWPIQSRIIEIAAGRDVISIFTTIVDIDAPLVRENGPYTPAGLASIGRELAANDPQERTQINRSGDGTGTRHGAATDRNTQLLVPAPFPLPDPHVNGTPIAVAAASDGSTQRLEVFGTNNADQIFHSLFADGTLLWGQFDRTMRSVAAAATTNGRIELFGVDADGNVFRRLQTGPSNWANSTWQPIDGSLTAIAAAAHDDGRVEIFGTNSVDAVVYRVQKSAGDWAGTRWQVLDGALSQVAATTTTGGRLQLFGVNAWGAIVYRTQNSAGTWTDTQWRVLPGALRTIAVATNSQGVIEVFGTNEDGQVLRCAQTAAGVDTWTSWIQFDPTNWAQYNIRQLAAGNYLGRLRLFGVDIEGIVFSRETAARAIPQWTDWTQLPGVLRGDILPSRLPHLQSPGNQDTPIGTAVNLGLSGTGTAPFTWSYSGLPAGLSGGADGRITGAPTAAGWPTVTVTMNDANRQSTTTQFTWHTYPVAIVPDVIGVLYTTATTTLQKAGFVVKKTNISTDDRTEAGKVLSEEPVSGTHFILGGQVHIEVGQFVPNG